MARSRNDLSAQLDRISQEFGDLLYDLATTLSAHAPAGGQREAMAHQLFRQVLKDIRWRLSTARRPAEWGAMLRPWVLRQAYLRFQKLHGDPLFTEATAQRAVAAARDGSTAGPKDPVAETTPSQKLRNIWPLLSELAWEDRFILTLRDKHQIPLAELSAITSLPERALALKRGTALRNLEARVWEGSTPQ